jgi:hypothetical protein
MRIAQISPLIESVPPKLYGGIERDCFLHKARSLSRQAVRDRFDQRFTIERVAHDYVRVYNSLAAEPILRVTGGTPRRGGEVRPLRAPLGRGITIEQPPLQATEQKKQGMIV